MFEKFFDFFAGSSEIGSALEVDGTGRPTEENLHVAAAVLLVEVAGSDDHIAPQEAEAVVKMMSQQFGLDEEEIPELIKLAVVAKKEKGKIDEFLKAINDALNEDQRKRLFAMVWKVVLADGKIDQGEERLAVAIRYRLQLSKEQALAAEKMAVEGEV